MSRWSWPFGGTRETPPEEPDPLDPTAWGQAGGEPDEDVDRDPMEQLDLDDGGQQRVTQFVQARETAYVAGLRQQLQKSGWDLNPEGQVVIRDPRRVGESFGLAPLPAIPAPTAPPPVAPVPAPETEMPNPYEDLRGFQRWQEEQFKVAIASAKEELLGQIGGMRTAVSGGLASEAVRISQSALEQIGYGHIGAAPKFAEHLQLALQQSGVPLEQWRDPGVLVRLAMLTIPDLVEDGGIPAPQPRQAAPAPRDTQGRFAPAPAPAPQERAFADLARQGLSLMSPSESAGAPRERGAQDPDIATFAQLEGISYAEAEALANDKLTNHEYAAIRTRAAGRRGNR